MAKMTKEEKKAKLDAKKAEAKAKKDAKRAAALEKKMKQAEAKKAKKAAKKAKKLAKLEKEKAKKAALKEKKRLAKEKQAALKTAKTDKAAKMTDKSTDGIDIREASKTIKLAMAQIAAQMAELNDEKRAKKAKSIKWMGYDVATANGVVTVKFVIEKTKKAKASTPVEDKKEQKPEVKKVVIDEAETTPAYPEENEEQPQNVEVPAGDLYGQNGNLTGEIANIDNDDELEDDELEDDEETSIADFRDEQDEELVSHRSEFFSQFGEDFEPNDD